VSDIIKSVVNSDHRRTIMAEVGDIFSLLTYVSMREYSTKIIIVQI